jgi:hypothetical protein
VFQLGSGATVVPYARYLVDRRGRRLLDGMWRWTEVAQQCR